MRISKKCLSTAIFAVVLASMAACGSETADLPKESATETVPVQSATDTQTEDPYLEAGVSSSGRQAIFSPENNAVHRTSLSAPLPSEWMPEFSSAVILPRLR